MSRFVANCNAQRYINVSCLRNDAGIHTIQGCIISTVRSSIDLYVIITCNHYSVPWSLRGNWWQLDDESRADRFKRRGNQVVNFSLLVPRQHISLTCQRPVLLTSHTKKIEITEHQPFQERQRAKTIKVIGQCYSYASSLWPLAAGSYNAFKETPWKLQAKLSEVMKKRKTPPTACSVVSILLKKTQNACMSCMLLVGLGGEGGDELSGCHMSCCMQACSVMLLLSSRVGTVYFSRTVLRRSW